MVIPAPSTPPAVAAPSEAACRAARALIRWGTFMRPTEAGDEAFVELVDGAGDILIRDVCATPRAAEVMAVEAINEVADVIDRVTGVGDLTGCLVMTKAEATAAMNLWRLRKHGTDPRPAVDGMIELLTRIVRRIDGTLAGHPQPGELAPDDRAEGDGAGERSSTHG
jgi:hypothetical protein